MADPMKIRANVTGDTTEVKVLMSLFQSYLRMETGRCVAEGVRIRMIGRRDRLAPALQKAVAETEAVTRNGRTLEVRAAAPSV